VPITLDQTPVLGNKKSSEWEIEIAVKYFMVLNELSNQSKQKRNL
jgi:hypothetical protein